MKPSQQARLVLGLIHVTGKIQRKLGGALSVHGLGVSEYLVLLQLVDAPDFTMRRIDLADSVGLTASGVTRLLNPMEKIGLVKKTASSRDARVSLVTLSSAGKRTLEEVGVAVNDTAQSLLGAFDAQQRRDLAGLIQMLG